MAHRTRLKKWIWILGICILGSLGVGRYYFMSSPFEEKKILPLTVQVKKMVPQELTLQRRYIGYVMPINSVEVHPFLAGFIEDILVEDGADVLEGQTLFILKQDEYKAKLALEQANVLSAEAALVNAHQYYQRLLKTGEKAVALAQLDEGKASFLSALASLEAAKAAEQVAKVNYDYTTICAPISGRIGTIKVSLGDYVAPSSDALVRIIQEDPIRVMFSISDKDYVESYSAHHLPFEDWTISLQLADGRRYPETGTLSYTNNEINSKTNALTMYADFSNGQRLLVTQAYVDVLLEKTLHDVFVLSLDQLSWEEDIPFVFILNNQQIIEKRQLSLGPVQGENVVILKGLTTGEKVVMTSMGSENIGKKANIASSVEEE